PGEVLGADVMPSLTRSPLLTSDGSRKRRVPQSESHFDQVHCFDRRSVQQRRAILPGFDRLDRGLDQEWIAAHHRNALKLKASTLRTILTQAGVARDEFLRAY